MIQSMQPIDKTGESTGPKQYQLWLSHDELHLLYWAMTTAIALSTRDTSVNEAVELFAQQQEHYEQFVAKFNAVHELARADDRE